MKKILFTLLCLLSILCLIGMPFFCTHSDMLPEKRTEYYAKDAQNQASSATGAEAELMALLLGGGAAMAPAVVEETPEEAFSLSFSSYGLYLSIGAALAILMLLIGAKLRPALRASLLWTAALSLPLGLLGARIAYCASQLSFYFEAIKAPEAMLKIWEGGFSMAGAIIAVILSGMLGARLGKGSTARVLDCLILPLMIFVFFGIFAMGKIGIGFGPELENSLPVLSVEKEGYFYLNTPLLMMLFTLLPALASRKKRPHGHAFALSAFLYGGGMILLESLRRDGHMLMGFVHIEMMLDMALALPALLYLAWKSRRILWALFASVILAGAVIGLEFALDRSAVSDLLLYAVYFLVISGYLWLGWSCAKKAAHV